jgi:hypothetical protein
VSCTYLSIIEEDEPEEQAVYFPDCASGSSKPTMAENDTAKTRSALVLSVWTRTHRAAARLRPRGPVHTERAWTSTAPRGKVARLTTETKHAFKTTGLSASAYIVSRGLAKAGSNEPY